MLPFCSKCDNLLSISKVPTQANFEEVQQNNKGIEKYIELITKIEKEQEIKEEDYNNLDISILLKMEELKKIKNKQKTKEILAELQNKQDVSDISIKAYFVCNTCLHTEPIQSGKLIYSKNMNLDKNDNIYNDMISNKVFSNVLPYTREYNCRNKECPTYKGTPREAVFFRTSNKYNTWYCCKVCKTAWNIS